jgi:hypothetical protein
MKNATAQLVVDPLFRRGVFFFRGGIREHVLENLFSPKDLFRKQVKTGKEERVNHEIANESKKQIDRKLTLEWYASLVEYCPPRWVAFLCPPWPQGFLLSSKGRRCEVMEVYTSGFAGHPGGYFIDCESALGVMTGWRTLLEYQAVGFSSRVRRVFVEQCLWFQN